MATAGAFRLFTSLRPSTAHLNLQAVTRRRLLSASPASTTTEAGGAGDPALHSGDAPIEEYTERPARFSAAEDAAAGGAGHANKPPPSSELSKERVAPFGPSGKLGTQELPDAASGSSFTQRRLLSRTAPEGRDAREDATPGREEAAARKVREEDREYYRTHKPSPLAEVEFADTRKPVTRATDGGGAADRAAPEVTGNTVQDTVDDSLARAEAMFREAAQRGNPEWPHSRALAEMLARREQRNDAPWSS